jgi:hypothetical protein
MALLLLLLLLLLVVLLLLLLFVVVVVLQWHLSRAMADEGSWTRGFCGCGAIDQLHGG